MIKLNILIVRRPDLSLEEFKSHWKDIHGPLFRSQPEVQQNVKRYIQAHSTGESLDQFPTAPYDGIAQIWVDRLEDIDKVFGSENYNKYIAPDEAKFIDREKIVWIYSTENVVMP